MEFQADWNNFLNFQAVVTFLQIRSRIQTFHFCQIAGYVYETFFDSISADLIITQNHKNAPIFLQGIFHPSLADDVNDQEIEIMMYEDDFGHKCKQLEPKQV